MNEETTLKIINNIFYNIFNQDNPNTINEILEKYAFDIKLPKEVRDSTTNEITWADSVNPTHFITLSNMEKKDNEEGWMLPRQDISSLEDIIRIWNTINYITTERVYDSINVSQSDTIYNCQNVFRSTDCHQCKSIVFCDSCSNSEYILACQRSNTLTFCIRTDDSKDCSNSYNITCSSKISNSLFIQDSYNLYECIFCSHIANKKYCIANMQFEENEYYQIKQLIINWIINSK